MAKVTEISAAEWLSIRDAVAKAVGTQSRTTSTREIAEHLLGKGWIDVEAVAADVIPRPVVPAPGAGPGDEPAPEHHPV